MTTFNLSENQELLAVVLEEVNAFRCSFGAGPLPQLLPGTTKNPVCCSLARSLDCGYIKVRVVNDSAIRLRWKSRRTRAAVALLTRVYDARTVSFLGPSYRESLLTTPAMREFINRFDQGKFPELVAE